jgi:bacterioferritin-associated ferredoxin
MDSEEWEALGELRDYQRKIETDLDFLICECKSISLENIKSFISANDLKELDLDQLKKELGLGSGCSSCIKSKESWEKFLSF